MRNPIVFVVRLAMRVVRASVVLVAVPTGLLVLGARAAFAQGAGTTAHAGATTVTFGLLGPVGLAAVGLGIVGMVAYAVAGPPDADIVVTRPTTPV